MLADASPPALAEYLQLDTGMSPHVVAAATRQLTPPLSPPRAMSPNFGATAAAPTTAATAALPKMPDSPFKTVEANLRMLHERLHASRRGGDEAGSSS